MCASMNFGKLIKLKILVINFLPELKKRRGKKTIPTDNR